MIYTRYIYKIVEATAREEAEIEEGAIVWVQGEGVIDPQDSRVGDPRAAGDVYYDYIDPNPPQTKATTRVPVFTMYLDTNTGKFTEVLHPPLRFVMEHTFYGWPIVNGA
jgi:hypothetical protein